MLYIRLFILSLLLSSAAFSQSVVTLEQRTINWNIQKDTSVVSWNSSFKGYETLTTQEKDIFYWTNYSRKNAVKFWDSVVMPLISIYPQLSGKYAASLKADLFKAGSLPMFALNVTLNQTAKAHAFDIGEKSVTVSHTSTNGTPFSKRLQDAGIKYCGSENMSLGTGDVIISLALLYLDIGLENLGHRKTLLNPSYAEIGIGATTYGGNQTFFVQDFSCKQD